MCRIILGRYALIAKNVLRIIFAIILGFDRKNFGWFVCGCILFTLARKLSRLAIFFSNANIQGNISLFKANINTREGKKYVQI